MGTHTIEMTGRYNFHNAGPINVRPIEIETREYDHGPAIYGLISARTYRRVLDHFCGISDCTCGSGPAVTEDSGYWGHGDPVWVFLGRAE